MIHAEKVREAERAVVEAASVFVHEIGGRGLGYEDTIKLNRKELGEAVRVLDSLRAATCPTCGGTGWVHPLVPERPCTAGCKEGAKP